MKPSVIYSILSLLCIVGFFMVTIIMPEDTEIASSNRGGLFLLFLVLLVVFSIRASIHRKREKKAEEDLQKGIIKRKCGWYKKQYSKNDSYCPYCGHN